MNPTTRITLSIALLLMACAGCTSVKYTRQYYDSTTAKTYPPKPSSYKVPILNAAPDRPYEIIGRLTFNASHGHDFMIRAVEYNARQAGADAAILLILSSSEQQSTYQVSGHTSMVPVPSGSFGQGYENRNEYGPYGRGNSYGPADLYGYPHNAGYGNPTAYAPVYHPGYTSVKTVVVHSLDAEMIVYK